MENEEVNNLKALLEQAQELVQQYENIHQEIMEQANQQQQTMTTTLTNLNNSVNDEIDIEDDHKISSILMKVESVLRDEPNNSNKLQKQSSFLVDNGESKELLEQQLQQSGEETHEEEKSIPMSSQIENQVLMTQLQQKQFPSQIPQEQLSLVDSVLQDDYLKRIQDAYKFPEDVQQYNNSLTEQLTNYGDDKMSELQSIITTQSVVVQQPKLSKDVANIFSKYHKTEPEVLNLDIPKINNQPDYLREQIFDKKINQYLHAINQCIKHIQSNQPKLDEKELQELIVHAEIQNQDEQLATNEQVEQLCDMIENEVNITQHQPDMISVLDKYHEQEQKEQDQIQKEEEKFYKQMQQEEQLRKEATATNQLKQVIAQAQELLQEQPKKRVSSAKPILDQSQGPAQSKVKVKKVPNQLEKIQQ